MGYCSAINCKNKTSDGIRLFRFPKDKDRRAQWVQNCQRDKWQPTDNSVLCEHHFEESQFELKRQDGKRLLKWNSVPTIFDVPNPPKPLETSRKAPDLRTSSPKRKKIEEPTESTITVDSNIDCQTPNVSEEKISQLELENINLKIQIKQLTERQNAMEKNLDRFLKPDQIQYLKKTSTSNPYKWTNQTIRHALQVKCAVGSKGYEFLRKSSYPLPSKRTLSRRIESCQFEPGIQSDIIGWLGIKLKTTSDKNELCVLSLDEMQLRPYVEYDKGLKRYVGFVSTEFSSSNKPEIASHALVFIVRGLTFHWKQVVAYALTGNSTNHYKLWNFIKELIVQLYNNGLTVKCVTSDMGSNNRGMWGVIGVHSIRNHVSCKIDHPCKQDEKIYFVADVPHLLKNIRNCLLAQDIHLPEELVRTNSLNSNEVSVEHVSELIEAQEKGGPVLVPNLTKNVVNPSTFEKMRVPIARVFFSASVSSALLFCVSVGLINKNAVATSWFIQQIDKWYLTMLSRHKSDALSQSNSDKICFLKKILEWFPLLRFNGRAVWKPIQAGLQLSTTSAVELYEELVTKGAIDYLLTSRLSSDCVENFFSQVRETGDSHPTPVKLRHVIRMISIAQYSHSPNSSNYDVDDDEYYLDFFSKKSKREIEVSEHDSSDNAIIDELNLVEESGLYYLAGWVIHQLVRVKKTVTCQTCIASTCSPEPLDSLPHEWVSILNRGNLIHPTDDTFSVCRHCELIFQKHSSYYLNKSNVMDNLLHLTLNSCEKKLYYSCKHDITELVITKYLSLRLHVLAKEINRENVNRRLYGSKTAFMRSSATNHF